jgi:hypothetical protein
MNDHTRGLGTAVMKNMKCESQHYATVVSRRRRMVLRTVAAAAVLQNMAIDVLKGQKAGTCRWNDDDDDS